MSLDNELRDAVMSWEPAYAFNLINQGANPNVKIPEHKNQTAFMVLAKSTYCSPQVLDDMLLFGADANLIDPYGDTLMHYLSWGGWVDKVKVLLMYGAKFQKNADNKTPLDYALDSPHGELVVQFFEEYFKKLEQRAKIEGAPGIYFKNLDQILTNF